MPADFFDLSDEPSVPQGEPSQNGGGYRPHWWTIVITLATLALTGTGVYLQYLNNEIVKGGDQAVLPDAATTPEPDSNDTGTGAKMDGPLSEPDELQAPPPSSRAVELSQGQSATAGYWYEVALSGFPPGSQVTVSCSDSVDQGFYTTTLTVNSSGRAEDPTLCYSADGPDHWVTADGLSSNRVTW